MPEFEDLNGMRVTVETKSEALNALEAAARAIWNPPATHAEKVELFKQIESAYFHASGWHLTGSMKPRSEGVTMMAERAIAGRMLPLGVESPKENP